MNIDTPEKIARRARLNREADAAERSRIERLDSAFNKITDVQERSVLRAQFTWFGLGAVITQLINWIIQ